MPKYIISYDLSGYDKNKRIGAIKEYIDSHEIYYESQSSYVIETKRKEQAESIMTQLRRHLHNDDKLFVARIFFTDNVKSP